MAMLEVNHLAIQLAVFVQLMDLTYPSKKVSSMA